MLRTAGGLLLILRKLHPRLAQAIDYLLDMLGFVPLGILLPRRCGEIRTQRQQLLQRLLRLFFSAKLAERCRTGGMRMEISG